MEGLFRYGWQEFWVLCVVWVSLGVVGVPRGQALHLLTDHIVAILLPGAALSTLGTGSCKIMGPCWRLVVTTSHRESGTHSYNTWQTHTYTQWLSDRQTHKVTHSDDTHTDTLIVRHAGLNFPKSVQVWRRGAENWLPVCVAHAQLHVYISGITDPIADSVEQWR